MCGTACQLPSKTCLWKVHITQRRCRRLAFSGAAVSQFASCPDTLWSNFALFRAIFNVLFVVIV